jgi:hypothetical protein
MSQPPLPPDHQHLHNIPQRIGQGATKLHPFKELAERMAHACPLTWMAITGKRYLVPTYRQSDYYNQETLDKIMAFFLATYVSGDYGPRPDHIIRTLYLSSILGLKEQRPMYFLERELGEALMRTQLPGDLVTDDIHWRWGSVRIMLPKGLISIERKGEDRRDVMYLDISKAKAGAMNTLPVEMTRELGRFALQFGRLRTDYIPTPIFEQDGMVVACQLSGDMTTNPGLNYGLVRPFEGRKLKDIRVGGHFETGSLCDETDDQLLDRMEHLALNVLLFMGSVPLEYDTEAKDPIRKTKVVNDRVIPGLWAAKFVGRSQYRPSQKPSYHTAQFTGRKLPRHWRAGHWKRQVYGPGREERKLIWIEPYETVGPQEGEAA